MALPRRLQAVAEAVPAGAARLWVLQPMQRLERLREWLAAQGHHVERELSVTDRRRVYTVLVVRPRPQ